MNRDSTDLTLLASSARAGDRAAHDRVYEELREMARRNPFVGGEGQTLQPTALVNEAYLMFEKKYPVPPRGQPENRATFFLTVALAMRTILRDHWRQRNTKKRGGELDVLSLGTQDHSRNNENDLDTIDFLSLDDAIDKLETFNKRWCDVVMHRYFAGRSIAETAELMGVGVTSVKTDWQLARAWLRRELGEKSASSS